MHSKSKPRAKANPTAKPKPTRQKKPPVIPGALLVPSPEILLGAIVDSTDDAIISKDLHSIITSWNRGAEQLFGYTREEAVGRPVTFLLPAARQGEEKQIMARIKA